MSDKNLDNVELGVDWYFNQYRDRKYLSSRMCSLLAYTANMLNNKEADKRELFLEVLYRLRPLAIFDFSDHPHPAVEATMKSLLRSPKVWTTMDMTLFKGAYFALSHQAVLPPAPTFHIEIKPTGNHTRVKQQPIEADERPEVQSPPPRRESKKFKPRASKRMTLRTPRPDA